MSGIKITPEQVEETKKALGIGLMPTDAHSCQGQNEGISSKKGTSAVLTQCAANIAPVPINWIWPGWLPKGKLVILAGPGGVGKTMIALKMAAIVTSNMLWPDGYESNEQGNVLIWSAEDDPADTIIPRLIASGADLNRVHIVKGAINELGEIQPFDPARDIPLLRKKVDVIGGASLLIVDPIVSAVAGDMHKANDVRRSLQALVDFATYCDCGVLGITHFAKGGKATAPTDRVIGSQAFGALARIVLVCAKREDSTDRVLARSKSNISEDEGGFTYYLQRTEVASGIEATHACWGEIIKGTAREILQDVELEPDTQDYAEDIDQVLKNVLGLGEMIRNDVITKMKSEGFSDKQIRRARERLNITVRREGRGKDHTTFWSLPKVDSSHF